MSIEYPYTEEDDALDRLAKAKLPGDLQLVAFECDVGRDRRSWCESDWRAPDLQHIDDFLTVFDRIGCSVQIYGGEESIFGKSDRVRLRIDILAHRDLVEKHLRYGGGNRFHLPGDSNCLRKGTCDDDEAPLIQIGSCKARLYESFAYRSDENAGDFTGEWFLKNRSLSDLRDRFGVAEGFFQWLKDGQATEEDFEMLATLVEACGNDVAAVADAIRRTNAAPTRTSFLVPGLIPRGAITLLLGDKKHGKSAIAMELAVDTAQRTPRWLGFPLNADLSGFAVYLLGEDALGEAAHRIQRMTGQPGLPILLNVIPPDQTEIDELLSRLASQKIALLVVDPCRKYHHGNEDSSDTISELFTKLETFARAKNCAVLVLHHLKRNAHPRNVADLATLYRGSSVHVDRPRVVLGLRHSKGETELGIPNPEGVPLHNFPASEMFAGVRRLKRDEATFRHVPIGAISNETKQVSADEIERVYSAATRMLKEGRHVTRTGRAGIFEGRPPEASGISRARTRDAIDMLVAEGRLICDGTGALSAPVKVDRPEELLSTLLD